MFVEIFRAGREFDGQWAVRQLSTNFGPGSIIGIGS
jgi:hypothetical protein